MTHTPGPWSHRPASGKTYLDPAHRDDFEAISSGRDFFEAYVSGQDRAERLANARLIAAAPDLFRALAQIEVVCEMDGDVGRVRALAIARAAIAKMLAQG